MTDFQNNNLTDKEKEAKIEELRDIIQNAQETISSATQLLSTLQGKTPEEMPINNVEEEQEEGQVIYGYFDGQVMVGDDGKQYPVPANYASKSKLVEGDKLKLNITSNNRFVYKQVGPVPRNYLIGIVKKDDKGNYTVKTAGKEYRVLLAAATYFKIEPNDEVTLIVPQNTNSVWGAIENILQKNVPLNNPLQENTQNKEEDLKKQTKSVSDSDFNLDETKELENNALEKTNNSEKGSTLLDDSKNSAILDEWDNDIEKLKKEAGITINE